MFSQRSPSPANADKARPFKFAKYLSWSSLGIILLTGLLLTVIITNSARKTLLTKQREFAVLLAENLNHQIYRRFTLPTIIGFGRIALKQQAQYERLDQVVQSTIHGLHVRELNIYDFDLTVSYSTNTEKLGEVKPGNQALLRALEDGKKTFHLNSKLHPVLAVFSLETKPDSVTLRTIYPLRAERGLAGADKELEPIMGVLEFTQDITEDYRTVIRFQWLTISASFFSSLILFLVLVLIIRRADKLNAERLQERERYERELHQSEKLASMGRMVAGIAHEIRNPLGIIRSSSELLLRKPMAESELNKRILKAIYDESKRLSQTVNDFLDYARPKKPKQQLVDLSSVLDQAVVFLENEFSKRSITIDKNYWSGLTVLGDKDLLYRAVYNVLSNALQAMEQEGAVIIRASTDPQDITLEFEDTGPGFAEEYRAKLLDPFYTTKDDGTGLGLTIVNNIIQTHGGTLELQNGGEGGALVRMRFPAASGVSES